MLRGVLVKLAADRQLALDDSVVRYLPTHIERSFAAARARGHRARQGGVAARPAAEPGFGGGNVSRQRLVVALRDRPDFGRFALPTGLTAGLDGAAGAPRYVHRQFSSDCCIKWPTSRSRSTRQPWPTAAKPLLLHENPRRCGARKSACRSQARASAVGESFDQPGSFHQPRAVLAEFQSPRAGGIGQPQESAARAAEIPVDLRQQSRRVLHGARRRPRRAGARRHQHQEPGGPDARRAARAHRRGGVGPGRGSAGAVARAARPSSGKPASS